jgi:hypothetical protein
MVANLKLGAWAFNAMMSNTRGKERSEAGLYNQSKKQSS